MTSLTVAQFKKRRQRPEQQLHTAVAGYLSRALRLPTIWTAFPAGGGGKARGGQLKAMGLKAGWPDILIVCPVSLDTWVERRDPIPLLVGIELKAGKGTQSTAQKERQTEFVKAGGLYYIARSIDEVERILRQMGIPVYARALARKAA